MSLFGHISCLRPMTPLPGETLARDSTGMVPAFVLDDKSIERETRVADFLDVVDEIDEEKCQPVDDGIVGTAVRILTTKKDEAPPDTLERWVTGLLHLRPRVLPTNVATALVLSWMLDLCESGTARKSDADYVTRRRYCVASALPLWRMLSAVGGHPESWDMEALKAGYLALMEDPSIRDKTALGAGLSSFQSFLQEHWDIDLPPVRLHKLIPLPRPRAQFVTGVEIRRALDWISQQRGGDATLLSMSALAIALGWAAPFRVRELLYLRMHNIAPVNDERFEIEIVRFGWRNKLKSPAAVRRVQICDPLAVELLKQHLERRQREGASSKDLVFSSPQSPTKIHRQHALHRSMLRILKLSTGDPEMTFHALRHTWATHQVGDVLCSNSIVDFNRLIHVAEQMGHVTPATTLYFYSHRFEDAIHMHVSAGLRESLEVGAKIVQTFAGENPNTLCTRARRKGMAISDAVWRVIDHAAEGVSFPDVATDVNLVAPPFPVLSTTSVEGLTPRHVHEALRLLSNAVLTDALVAARTRTSLDQVTKIRTAVCRIARTQLQGRRQKTPVAIESVGAALDVMDIDLARASQPKFSKLREALALPIDLTVATEASQSWLSVRDRGYLSLDKPEKFLGLLQFLKFANVAHADLAVCMQYEDAAEVAAKVERASIQEVFQQAWSTAPHFLRTGYVHPARPNSYLTWPSRSNGKALRGAAASSNAGLEALLLSVTVYTQLARDDHVSA
jgi:integrase